MAMKALSTATLGMGASTCGSALTCRAKRAFVTMASLWRGLPKLFGPELMNVFRQFKAVWDPQNKMNPHKVVDAYLPTENLRLGADYKPLQPETHFKFIEDGGSFSSAAARCIGVGTCRK